MSVMKKPARMSVQQIDGVMAEQTLLRRLMVHETPQPIETKVRVWTPL